jgi:hypothetical protein
MKAKILIDTKTIISLGKVSMKLFASFAALLVGIFQTSGLAQLVQPPTCSFVFQNPAGYKIVENDGAIFERTKSNPFSIGIIVSFEGPGEGPEKYKDVFVWANSSGNVFGTYILPESDGTAGAGYSCNTILPSMSDSRVTLYDFFSNKAIYLTRSTRTNQLSIRVADNLKRYISIDDIASSLSESLSKGFVRIRQDSQLRNTTVEYFAP